MVIISPHYYTKLETLEYFLNEKGSDLFMTASSQTSLTRPGPAGPISD